MNNNIFTKLVIYSIILLIFRILSYIKVLKEELLRDMNHTKKNLYEFRPYEILKVCCEPGKSKHPTARSGHRVVCTESHLYCLGGFNPDQDFNTSRRRRVTSLFQELWSFNFATKKWRLCLNYRAKDMPEELASNAVTVTGNLMIAYGGTGFPFGEACSNQSYIFSTRQPSVTRLKVDGELPTPQYGPAIVIHKNYLYTIGGTTGHEYSCDVHRLDLNTKHWESIYSCRPEMRDDPSGRYRHEIVYTGKLIYILGGGTAENAFDLVNLPAFDLENNCWLYVKTKPDSRFCDTRGYPQARRCHSCIQYCTDDGIEAVIAGGCADNEKYFSDIWKLDFNKMQWTFLSQAKLPYPIYFHSAATPGNGCMYLFGGIEVQDTLTRTNDLYKMWATIPKLSEMCWDAITFYKPDLSSHSKDALIRMGIPRIFLKRL